MSNTFPLASGAFLAPVLSLTGTPPDAVVGKGYFFRPQPAGGATGRTLTFSLTAGTLPDGFTFSTHTGTIRGSATAAGTASGLTISVTDGFSTATLGPLSITVAAASAGVVALTKSQVATNFNVPDFFAGSATTSTNRLHVYEVQRWAGFDLMADIQLGLSAYRVDGTGEVNAAGYRGAMHVAYNGVVVVCTWAGATTIDIASGEAMKLCDPIQPSAFGVASIPDQSMLTIRLEKLFAEAAVPTLWYSGAVANTETSKATRGDPALATQIGVAGALKVNTGGWANLTNLHSGPQLVIAKGRKGQAVGTAVVGASIENGANDAPGDGTATSGGYIRRGMVTGKYRAYSCNAVGGETASEYLTRRAKRSIYEQYADAGANGFGGNDFSNGSGVGLPTPLRNVNAALTASGVKKVAQIRMTPKSDSTDGWISADGSNQTVRVNSTSNNFLTVRNAVDAAAAEDVASGVLAMTIDTTPVTETGPNTGLWKGNGSTGSTLGATSDGTHPGRLPHGSMATLVAPQFDALINLAKAAA